MCLWIGKAYCYTQLSDGRHDESRRLNTKINFCLSYLTRVRFGNVSEQVIFFKLFYILIHVHICRYIVVVRYWSEWLIPAPSCQPFPGAKADSTHFQDSIHVSHGSLALSASQSAKRQKTVNDFSIIYIFRKIPVSTSSYPEYLYN